MTGPPASVPPRKSKTRCSPNSMRTSTTDGSPRRTSLSGFSTRPSSSATTAGGPKPRAAPSQHRPVAPPSPRDEDRHTEFRLAADYVRTTTDLASMEGANEAVRRATNAILDQSVVDAESCALYDFAEPTVFEPLKRQDELRYRLGLPHPSDISTEALRLGRRLTPRTPPTLSWLSRR